METKHRQPTVDDIRGWLQTKQKTKTKQTRTEVKNRFTTHQYKQDIFRKTEKNEN